MELELTRLSSTQGAVTCNGQYSHPFDLPTLLHTRLHPLSAPIAYGKIIYSALFPSGTLAYGQLKNAPQHLLLIPIGRELDAILWEYGYGIYGDSDDETFLALKCHLVRGLPKDQRIDSPKLMHSPYIVAVPSNPLSHAVPSLNIEGEWMRLKEIVQTLSYTITLERTRPPSLEQLGLLLPGQSHSVVHFMGHGGQEKNQEAILCFERDNGDLDVVSAQDFIDQVRGKVFLVALNACASAFAGETHLSNLAAALVQQKVPYALGMRFNIPDEAALVFSRTFYNYIARGASVEEALYQVRLVLGRRQPQWMIGVPVLYTSLNTPASGFASITGNPTIKDHQPRLEVNTLPGAVGTFQGRTEEIKVLGTALTGDKRSRIITIHGGGGQGKTTLAREAAERFAYAWPGGVWAITLEHLPSREAFVNDLGPFLGILLEAGGQPVDLSQLEMQIMERLRQYRTLLILDNAETLIDAVETRNAAAIHLAEFLLQLPRSSVSLLITSRVYLGWPEEVPLELGGILPEEGAALFWQNAPQRAGEINRDGNRIRAQDLSLRIEGHPLSLRLLGGAFNASSLTLAAFLEEYETRLVEAENKFIGEQHRHRTLYASIKTSVDFLDEEHRKLLGKLWLFHAPFHPETAQVILDPQRHEDAKEEEATQRGSPVGDQLHMLWRRGLLDQRIITVAGKTLSLYHLRPTMRPYIKQFLATADESELLQQRFGTTYEALLRVLLGGLNQNGAAASLILLLYEDLDQAASYLSGPQQGNYLVLWGFILQRLGERQHGEKLFERAVEIAQEHQDQSLKRFALSAIAGIYRDIGEVLKALQIYEELSDESQRDRQHSLQKATELTDQVKQNADKILAVLEQTEQLLSSAEAEGSIKETEPDELAQIHQQYREIRQKIEKARDLQLFTREWMDRAAKWLDLSQGALTLNHRATIYIKTGKFWEALLDCKQALELIQQLDPGPEATFLKTTLLGNMAEAYRRSGKPEEALKLLEQALSLAQEMGRGAEESGVLNNMAAIYQQTGNLHDALRYCKQALSLAQKMHHPEREVEVLNNIAVIHQQTGNLHEALQYCEQAMRLAQKTNNLEGEAAALNNMAEFYRQTGNLQKALRYYEQALPLMVKIGNRAGETAVLSNIAAVYQQTGDLQEAFRYCEQALSLAQETDNLEGKAITLNNLAELYRQTGNLQEALRYYEQALPLMVEIGKRAGEVAVLNNIAVVYQQTGDLQGALRYCEQALSLARKVENRAGEATVLNTKGLVYCQVGQPEKALEFLEQALSLIREVQDSATESTILFNIGQACLQALKLQAQASQVAGTMKDDLEKVSVLLNDGSAYIQRAIISIEQSLALMEKAGLSRNMGGQTREELQQLLDALRQNPTLVSSQETKLPPDQVQQMILSTIISVIVTAQEYRGTFREAIAATVKAFQRLQQRSDLMQIEIDFFMVILDTVDGKSSTLYANHPYEQAITAIQRGIATLQQQPLHVDLITLSVKALVGTSQEKKQHKQLLLKMVSQTTDNQLRKLIVTIWRALSGRPFTQLGQELEGVSQLAWSIIVAMMSMIQQQHLSGGNAWPDSFSPSRKQI